MSQFYARYVPLSRPVAADDPLAPSPPNAKRKREGTVLGEDHKKKKRVKQSKKVAPAADDHGAASSEIGRASGEEKPSSAQPDPLAVKGAPPAKVEAPVGANILNKYRVTTAAQNGSPTTAEIRVRRPKPAHVSKEARRRRVTEPQHGASQEADTPDSKNKKERASHETHAPKMKKKKDHASRKTDTPDAGSDDGPADTKHSGVLSRFEKAKRQRSQAQDYDDDNKADDYPPNQEAVELRGLEPLPQPEQVDVVPEPPTYSTLPRWQRTPLMVPTHSDISFQSLHVPDVVLANLQRQGLTRAFPIQATMVPMLLPGGLNHPGDVCVSAATGSGKTLAYVLPIVAALRDLAGTKLRAVIVVPTRELVKQVRATCEMCAAGTSLKVATAVGSKSWKEEQESLVAEDNEYDLIEYQRRQQAPVDWSTVSLDILVRQAHAEDPVGSIGLVKRPRSKVDVLITTPGRLVDHLRSTPGFHLDHVKWLVVDEADRLLNESYQEWIDTVVPALQRPLATQPRDDFLRSMKLTPPPRRVTKVLLSATMTRDLSKLNALELHDPKLVVLGGTSAEGTSLANGADIAQQSIEEIPLDHSGAFQIPASLVERAISVPDGSEKPLYLLMLLEHHLGIASNPSKETGGGGPPPEHDRTSTSASTSSSSSSDTDSDTSSSSDDLSDSDDLFTSTDSTTSDESDARTATAVTPRATLPARSPRTLIFTRSTESAVRLARLLCLLDPGLAPRVATLTRNTSSSASSRRALTAFRKSTVSVLIATDRASRGLDVPDLEHVISYDVPNSVLTYVHRVGRTARAGKVGRAWTLVENREAAWFWREIGGKRADDETAMIRRHDGVGRITFKLEPGPRSARYEEALRQLGEEVTGRRAF